jgi:hypothetical protein
VLKADIVFGGSSLLVEGAGVGKGARCGAFENSGIAMCACPPNRAQESRNPDFSVNSVFAFYNQIRGVFAAFHCNCLAIITAID